MSSSSASDLKRFLTEWRRDPLTVAAIAPSGRALAEIITSEISPLEAPVVELGPGTGVFTRRLLGRGVPEERLVLIEYGASFAQDLQSRFPLARVHQMDACALRKRPLIAGEPAGAVVSGLPLLSMSPRRILAILEGVFLQLRPEGAFYQFTYGFRCPAPRPLLDRLGLKATRIGGTLANLPPAAVYRIERRRLRTPL
ncbi:methyltransferase type 12 [Neomegalonema sp.]|uniref:class I SAM-dependent methyltransferase n=1 Tax=Neomegalonema sp. TaxID=2039713 RepID=UPI0026145980|nr:methyltransferase type 12 [Neomegalonema sp.]MDD2868345.1 methyltransferase type 12 [Neomegalonema sp.]